MKSKSNLKKIKCDFFLSSIFNNFQKIKTLEIIKYNKRIQKILGVNINDYKEYYEKVEIIIKPKQKLKNKYNKFINFEKKEEIIYFHIYFNDSNKEKRRNFFIRRERISKIKIIIDKEVESFSSLFQYCDCIESIYFKKFYRNNIQDKLQKT